jgi:hypothetical protein
MPSPYKRGRSGYSEKDEAEAKRYAELVRIEGQNSADRKAAGEKGYAPGLDSNMVKRMSKRGEEIYKENLTTSEGRDVNRKNIEFRQGEVNKIFQENSRAQYESEKEAGDPNALRMSFAEWKKL